MQYKTIITLHFYNAFLVCDLLPLCFSDTNLPSQIIIYFEASWLNDYWTYQAIDWPWVQCLVGNEVEL